MVSLSVLLQVFFLPILGAVADYSYRKRQFLAFTAYLGAFATMGMYFLQGDNYLLGGGLFLVANFAFGAAIVFYNAFLPDIASPDDRDRVSSQGWALGYLGGGLLLALNLVFVQFLAEPLGVSTRPRRAHIAGVGGHLVGDLHRHPAGDVAQTASRQIAASWRALCDHRLQTAGSHLAPSSRSFPRPCSSCWHTCSITTASRPSSRSPPPLARRNWSWAPSTLVQVILMVQFIAFCRRAALQQVSGLGRHQARHPHQPGHLARCHGLHVRVPAHRPSSSSSLPLHRHCPGRQPGPQPLALLTDDPEGAGGGVLQPLRDQRTRHKLAWAAALRTDASIDRQLSVCDLVSCGLLRCRPLRYWYAWMHAEPYRKRERGSCTALSANVA